MMERDWSTRLRSDAISNVGIACSEILSQYVYFKML